MPEDVGGTPPYENPVSIKPITISVIEDDLNAAIINNEESKIAIETIVIVFFLPNLSYAAPRIKRPNPLNTEIIVTDSVAIETAFLSSSSTVCFAFPKTP